ncbi:MAG: hypothetical protein ACT4OY_04470 [Alphaproteobacteria bacterium]
MVLSLAGPVRAQGEPPTCSPDFNEAMEARAWLGAARQMESAQKLIKGPQVNGQGVASVLQLICFTAKAVKSPAFSGSYGPSYTSNLIVSTATQYLKNFGGPACKNMKPVWNAAKCSNFGKDNFITLSALVNTDIRGGCGGTRTDWTNNFAAAYPAPGPEGVDPQVTYLTNLNSATCGTPIPTGVIVSSDSDDYGDAVCASFKCHFTGTACSN